METVNQQIQSCQVNLILAPQTNPKIHQNHPESNNIYLN